MQPANLPTLPSQTSSPGELVGQFGRLSGTRRALNDPVTLIGQATACDLRVSGDGVLPLHCAIFADSGPLLRDLGSSTGTRVNGRFVSSHRLVNGDVVEVGQDSFVFHANPVTAEVPSADAVLGEREREALRIQSAAVVAQQAALDEVEGRLDQRAAALTRQEEQLAGHLEQRQHEVDEQEETIQEERIALAKEADQQRAKRDSDRQEVERLRRVASEESAKLAKERKEVEGTKAQLQKQFERQWSDKEADLARRETELKRDEGRLQAERDKVQAFHERVNTERELSRRELKEAYQELALDRQRWEETLEVERAEQARQKRELEILAAEASSAREALLAQLRESESAKARMSREVEGLEARVVNARARLDAIERQKPTSPVPMLSEPIIPPPASVPEPALPDSIVHLNAELMDQRTRLSEQWQKFLGVQQQWEEDRKAVLDALEADHSSLEQRQRQIEQTERDLTGLRLSLERQQEIVAQRRGRLEGAQARLLIEQAERAAKYESLQADLDSRERTVGLRLNHLDEIHRKRHERRLAEVASLSEARARTEEARRQYSALYEDCERLCQEWTRQERLLAARGLALERYRLELVQKSPDSARAEAQIAKLERLELTRHEKEAKRIEEQRQKLLDDRRSLDESMSRLRKQEEILTESLRHWEQAQSRRELEQVGEREEVLRLESEVRRLRSQKGIDERHLRQLSEELERMARGLIEDGDEPTGLSVAAA